jgi:hypothetical protein
MSDYTPTPKQEQAIRDFLQEAIVPLIEQVLVKKLGQAMSYAATELVQPKSQPLTDDQITEAIKTSNLYMQPSPYTTQGTWLALLMGYARIIEQAHGIG